MDFAFTEEQERIREAVAKVCARFDDAYWLGKDRGGGFPQELHRAAAEYLLARLRAGAVPA